MSAMDFYKVFYYAAKEGSITKAAQRLFITQPSASYAIKQLEEQLNIRLFTRKAKGVALTQEGSALFKYVEQSYLLIQAGERKVAEMRTFHDGVVRLGASDSLCKAYLLPFLEKFRIKYPGVRIILSHGKSDDISSCLLQGIIDCGIVHMPADPRVLVHAIKPIRDCFVATPGFVAAHIKDRDRAASFLLAELLQQPFVMLSENSRTRAFFNAYLQTYSLTLTPDLEVGSVDLLLEFVRKGMGVTFITRDFVAQDLESGDLIELSIMSSPIPLREIGIITRAENSLSLAAAHFVQSLTEHMNQV